MDAPRPRSQAQTKKLVLEKLAKGRTLTEICETHDGPTRQQVYAWRDSDKAFAEGYARALVHAGSAFADKAVARAREQAELASAGKLTADIARAMSTEIATLRWMAAHHDARFDKLKSSSADLEAADEDVEPRMTASVNVHIFLPDNFRDPEMAGPSEVERQHHRRVRAAEAAYRDKKLRGWVEAGDLTETQALLARSLWVLPGDAAWIPMPRAEEQPMIPYFPASEAAFNGHGGELK